jgi:hypothetical protein
MTLLDLSALESWLWEAACVIRGPIDAPKFKDYIPPAARRGGIAERPAFLDSFRRIPAEELDPEAAR